MAIIDYKTGKPRDQEDADQSLQLSLYAIAAQEKWGYKVGALIFHNLEENVPVLTMRSESELIAARDRVQGAAQGIADGIFEPKLGIHCNFCAYRSLCPEKEKRIPRRAEIPAAQPNWIHFIPREAKSRFLSGISSSGFALWNFESLRKKLRGRIRVPF